MDFALSTLNVDKVDVNEQNIDAVKFYEKNYERLVKDEQAKEYPLLLMKLETANNSLH